MVVYDALVGYTAKAHGLVLATRDERARTIYRGLDIEFEFFAWAAQTWFVVGAT